MQLEIKGQIVEIIYQNEVNGYTVAELENSEEIFTIVGYLPFIIKGDSLKLDGKFVTHQDYGRQFKIETFEKIMPETLDALQKYLGGGVIKGIGPATAEKIIAKFKEATIEILKNEPSELSKIKGITKQRAEEISNEFNEKWELWQIVGFLEKFGISTENCKKVYEIYEKHSIDEIEKNPYSLIDIVYNADFKKIDKIAIELGISIDDYKRIESAIKYALIIASNNGNTCVIKENLIQYVKELLNVNEEPICECIKNLIAQSKIMCDIIDDGEWIFLNTFYACEKNIAEKLLALKRTKNIKKVKDFNAKLKTIEKFSKIDLSDKQRIAIEAVNENNVCVITGGPGTGKTTIIKFIIDIYKREGKKVALCAPTGRAAKRMSEATGHDAMTIHRLLELGKTEDTFNIEKLDYPITPIDADIIIVDEMSMVDIFIMNYILKGTYLGTKLVLVGDRKSVTISWSRKYSKRYYKFRYYRNNRIKSNI